MNSVPLESLTKEKFANALNTQFRVLIDSAAPVELQLVEVTAAPTVASSGRDAGLFESYSLMFAGPGERFLPQKMYSFEHEIIGRFDLFIVPVGREGGTFKYQAIFNRRIKSA
ncbi:MAG TPA: hypothetical protein VFB72_12695 [Verrucomicrobiae bacterium]|nr:hypothetical protein [Verrucomicrobiae bacterium]